MVLTTNFRQSRIEGKYGKYVGSIWISEKSKPNFLVPCVQTISLRQQDGRQSMQFTTGSLPAAAISPPLEMCKAGSKKKTSKSCPGLKGVRRLLTVLKGLEGLRILKDGIGRISGRKGMNN